MRIAQNFFLIILILTACEKESPEPNTTPPNPPCDTTFIVVESVDTIYPSPYLSAWPGSWWNYDNGDLELSFEWVEHAYSKWEKDDNGCWTKTTQDFVVPRTSYGVILGEYLIDNRYGDTQYLRLVGDVGVTQYLATPYDYYLVKYNYKTLNTLDSIEVNGNTYFDVLIAEQMWEFYESGAAGGPIQKIKSYYSKNVGLIYRHILYTTFEEEDFGLIDLYIDDH